MYDSRTADEATATTTMPNTIHAMDPDTAELFAEIDACLEAWGQSIEEGKALAREVLDACAVLEEWSC